MEKKTKTNYTLPKLTFPIDGLEPIISKEALDLHYHKHHQGYVIKLNEAIDRYHEAQQKNDVVTLVDIQSAIRFHGGGHINHSFFWLCLTSPNKAQKEPKGEFLKKITEEFGSFDKMREIFNRQAGALQGSGWAWLGYDKNAKKIAIQMTSNHETITALGLIPLMVIDVWEHAYYLQYQNRRSDYLETIWQILDWNKIQDRYLQVIS